MRDPVCGMDVLPTQAAATSLFEGTMYYFCARTCKRQFDKAPERFLHPAQQLSQYARILYDALETLNDIFYGPAAAAGDGKDLTAAEWDAVRLLGRQGACRMRELASGCNVALSTMTGIIDRLVKKGLVQRQHSEKDRRVVEAQLSGRGKLLYEERLDADMRLVLTMLHVLEGGEQREFVRLMQKIVHALSE